MCLWIECRCFLADHHSFEMCKTLYKLTHFLSWPILRILSFCLIAQVLYFNHFSELRNDCPISFCDKYVVCWIIIKKVGRIVLAQSRYRLSEKCDTTLRDWPQRSYRSGFCRYDTPLLWMICPVKSSSKPSRSKRQLFCSSISPRFFAEQNWSRQSPQKMVTCW